jgi:hypothetical protein
MRWIGELCGQRRRLQPEKAEQFGLKLVIAEALASKMNKIERRIETTGRRLVPI